MVLSKHLAGDAKTSSAGTTCGAAMRLGRVSFLAEASAAEIFWISARADSALNSTATRWVLPSTSPTKSMFRA